MIRRPILLDANSLIVRNIKATALEDLKADGTFTGGVFGAFNQLKTMLNGFNAFMRDKPGRVYAFFDDGVPQFRKDAIPSYKQERKEKKQLLSPEDKERAYKQIQMFREALPLVGVTVFSSTGWEADDLVACASRHFVDQHPIIVSGDKDLFQLVNETCSVCYLNDKTDLLTNDTFQDRVGVPTECFLVWKLLQGDNSDSIPGVYGIGETRATNLVLECLERDFRFGSRAPVDQLIEIINMARLRKPQRKSEASFWDDDAMDALALALTGIDLRQGAPDISLAIAHIPTVDRKAFVSFCNRCKFARFVADMENFIRPFASSCI